MKKLFAYAVMVIALIAGIAMITRFLPSSAAIISIEAFSLLILVSILLFLVHKIYEKTLEKINCIMVLAIVYAVIIANSIIGIRYYSIEWAFLVFALAGVIFYDFRIDSRFMVLPALLLLGYVPFLLIGKQDKIAETAAIYVYYFLVIGIAMQFAEYIKKNELKFEFDIVAKKFLLRIKWTNLLILFGLANIGIILLNRVKYLELEKWTLIYIYVLILIAYASASFIKKNIRNENSQ